MPVRQEPVEVRVRHDDGTWHIGFVRASREGRIMVTYSTEPGQQYMRWLAPLTDLTGDGDGRGAEGPGNGGTLRAARGG